MRRTTAAIALAGVALASPAAVADPHHDVRAWCEYVTHGVPNSRDALTHVVGLAAAFLHDPAVTTGVRCVLKDAVTLIVVYDTSFVTSGPVVGLVDTYRHRLYALEICSQGSALWGDGHRVTTPLECRAPF